MRCCPPAIAAALAAAAGWLGCSPPAPTDSIAGAPCTNFGREVCSTEAGSPRARCNADGTWHLIEHCGAGRCLVDEPRFGMQLTHCGNPVAAGTGHCVDTACDDGTTCDTASNTCVSSTVTTCKPKCDAASQFCDASVKPPVCAAITCQLPAAFGATVQRVTAWAIAPKADGCDLDGDGKPNNAFAVGFAAFLSQINGRMTKRIHDGVNFPILEATAFSGAGAAFAVNVVLGHHGANPECGEDGAGSEICACTVNQQSFQVSSKLAACPPVNRFEGCTVDKAGILQCGSKGQTFTFTLPIPNLPLALRLHRATLTGSVVLAGDTWIKTLNGKVCGLLTKQDIADGVNAISDEDFLQFGFGDRKTVIGMIAGLIKPDLDADGDGILESASAALTLTTVPGQIVGMTKP